MTLTGVINHRHPVVGFPSLCFGLITPARDRYATQMMQNRADALYAARRFPFGGGIDLIHFAAVMRSTGGV